jgi:hypothetical protein
MEIPRSIERIRKAKFSGKIVNRNAIVEGSIHATGEDMATADTTKKSVSEELFTGPIQLKTMQKRRHISRRER